MRPWKLTLYATVPYDTFFPSTNAFPGRHPAAGHFVADGAGALYHLFPFYQRFPWHHNPAVSRFAADGAGAYSPYMAPPAIHTRPDFPVSCFPHPSGTAFPSGTHAWKRPGHGTISKVVVLFMVIVMLNGDGGCDHGVAIDSWWLGGDGASVVK